MKNNDNIIDKTLKELQEVAKTKREESSTTSANMFKGLSEQLKQRGGVIKEDRHDTK